MVHVMLFPIGECVVLLRAVSNMAAFCGSFIFLFPVCCSGIF